MKRVYAALLFAAPMIAIDTGDAFAWTCRAESRGRTAPGHYGWAKRESESDARLIALYECAKRTPRSRKCRIVSCKRD